MGKIWNNFLTLVGLRDPRIEKTYLITTKGKVPITWLRSKHETHIHTLPKEYFPDYKKKE